MCLNVLGCVRSNAWSRGQKAPPCVYPCTPQTDGGWNSEVASIEENSFSHASKKVASHDWKPWTALGLKEVFFFGILSHFPRASEFQLCTARVQFTTEWSRRPRQQRSGLQTTGKCHGVPSSITSSIFDQPIQEQPVCRLPGIFQETCLAHFPYRASSPHTTSPHDASISSKKKTTTLELVQRSSGLDTIYTFLEDMTGFKYLLHSACWCIMQRSAVQLWACFFFFLISARAAECVFSQNVSSDTPALQWRRQH